MLNKDSINAVNGAQDNGVKKSKKAPWHIRKGHKKAVKDTQTNVPLTDTKDTQTNVAPNDASYKNGFLDGWIAMGKLVGGVALIMHGTKKVYDAIKAVNKTL